MLGKPQTDYSGFMNFWSIPYTRKFRTSNDVYLKLGSVTKLDKKNMTISKKLIMMFGQRIMRSSWFPGNGYLGGMQDLDSEYMVYSFYILKTVKKISNTALTLLL